MEPMALGSPTQSPKNNPMGFPSNAPFLPSFLMGEQQTSSTPRHGSLSPTKSRPSGLFRSPNAHQTDTSDRAFRPSFYQAENESLSIPKQPVSEKSGPPVKGLFDTLDSRYKYEGNTCASPDVSRIGTPTRNTSHYESFHNSTLNTYNDRFEKLTSTPNCHQFNDSVNLNQNRINNLSTDTWVTVLGFPSATTNMILAHFGQCGTILEKKFPNQGNWVHLKYATAFEASKALAFNGKILANCIMVGVIPYRPQEHANKENITMTPELMNSSAYSSTFTSPVRSARPLTTSFLGQQVGNSNTNEITSPVPQKSTGIVTKAMEYVFGW